MKRFILLTMCALLSFSCEDVIDVELNEAPPRLVIESNINISVEGASHYSLIKLTTTAPFFDDKIPEVENASVQITDENGNVFPFSHEEKGYYFSSFSPKPDMEYTLQVIYNEEIYTATTSLVSTVELEYVEQRNDGGFLGDQIELRAYFTDPPGEKNFYFFTGASERGISRDVFKDDFFEGNTMFGRYLADDLIPGDTVHVNLYGISEEFYNYMFILLQQTGGGGGPFETQPATVRGNIINQTNPDNSPLGYFRISEISGLDYVVE